MNGRPVIATLTATPPQLVPGDVLTLEATGVSDPDGGTVVLVEFYRDTNGNGTYQEGLDAPVGTDASAAGGWTLAFADSTAVRVFFARAQDDDGGWSLAASVDVPRRPTIGGLIDAPDPVHRDQNLVLTATDVDDIDGYVDGKAAIIEDIQRRARTA